MAVSSRETAISKNTLISLLQAIQGERTTVELRHENSVEGRIVSVDGYMNVELADVVYRSITGRLTRFEQFFIQGQHIRYVHIPDQINMLEAIQHNVTRKQRYLADMAKTMARNYAIKAARREQEWRRKEKMEQQKGS